MRHTVPTYSFSVLQLFQVTSPANPALTVSPKYDAFE